MVQCRAVPSHRGSRYATSSVADDERISRRRIVDFRISTMGCVKTLDTRIGTACCFPRELRQYPVVDRADVLVMDPLGHLRIISSPLVVS